MTDPIKIQLYKTRITGFCSVKLKTELKKNRTETVVLLYLSDVNNFVQLHEEPLNGIVDLPNLLLGHTDPC